MEGGRDCSDRNTEDKLFFHKKGVNENRCCNLELDFIMLMAGLLFLTDYRVCLLIGNFETDSLNLYNVQFIIALK